MFNPHKIWRNRRRFTSEGKANRFSMKRKRTKAVTRQASKKRREKSLMKRRFFDLDLKPKPKSKRKPKPQSVAEFATRNAADIDVDPNTGRVKFSDALVKKLGLKGKLSDGKQTKD